MDKCSSFNVVFKVLHRELVDVKPNNVLWIVVFELTFMLLTKYAITVPALAQILVYTIPVTYCGSILSLKAKLESNKSRKDVLTDLEVITFKGALMFPIQASIVLAGLYLAFRLFPVDLVNFLMNFAICSVGWYALPVCFEEFWKTMKPSSEKCVYNRTFPIPLGFRFCRRQIVVSFSEASFLGYVCATIICFGWLLTRHWFWHNLFAIGVAIYTIRTLSVETFKNATLLLVGLFFYDVFWVFKTNVMLTVAKTFNAPAKLLLPIGSTYAMLGLGDVVIPGLYIAFTLRFDHSRHQHKYGEVKGKSFDRFYFHSSLIAYSASLIVTALALLIWKTAQPALLYIVPCLLVSTYAPALIRGDLQALHDYTEEQDEEDEDDNNTRMQTRESDCVSLHKTD